MHSDDQLRDLAKAVAAVKIEKSMIGWDLEELESLALQEMDRTPDSDDEDEDETERMAPAPI